MARQDLIDYVKKANEAGYHDDQIRQKLLDSGWKKEDIDEAMLETELNHNSSFEKSDKKKDSFIETQTDSEDLFTKPDVPGLYESKKPEEQPIERKRCTLAIVAFVLSFIPILGIFGFILGIIALIIILAKKKKGLGFAIAAIVLSVVISIVAFLFLKEFISNLYMHIEI
jgi:hypothetical protein